MKVSNIVIFLTVVALLLASFVGCAATSDDNTRTDTTEPSATPESTADLAGSLGEMNEFRPVDCGIQAQERYSFPFIGLTATLSQTLLDKMDSREVFVFSFEDYTLDYEISYATLRFSATTEAQRAESGMSVDIWSWEGALEKIGAIGVYRKDVVQQLDELTACDTHEKFGESADGMYEYYLSTNSVGNAELVAELKASELSVVEMHDFDPNAGYTAFSEDRIDGVETVGTFSAEDIFGTAYTQELFRDYDLTLVNIFATWCSPCVEEIPELEKLRQQYAQKGIKLGVVAVVMDVKTTDGIDEGALDRAKALYERSGAQFPFLIPDDGNMNGRLTGIAAYPESFFVDSNGNIVSEPYVGANSLEGWATVVDTELAALSE